MKIKFVFNIQRRLTLKEQIYDLGYMWANAHVEYI